MPTATINGFQMNYELSGKEGAPHLLLCNSLASNLTMWDWQIDAFNAHFHVIRYDRRGHGKSGVPQGPYSIDDLADDAIGLLDHLGIAKTHFCGLSLGGMTGQKLGVRNPDRIDHLILADTGAFMGPAVNWESRIDTVRTGGMAATVDTTIDRWLTKPFQERDTAGTDKVRAMIISTPPEGFIGCCQAIRDMDQREDIKSITAPTLVICGEDDPSTTPEMARFLQSSIPGAKLALLPDAAHFANAEQPEMFNKAVLEFLGAA
jgi:3-oxoadipate enol-lactonase